jgi:protein SCO1/2
VIKTLLAAVLFLAQGLVHAQSVLPTESLYNLKAPLIDQSGKSRGLDVYRGQPVLVTMFYSSCPAACPLLIDTLRSIEKSLRAAEQSQLRVLLISIDPERDTVAALKELARVRRIDLSRWTLVRSDSSTVRKVAAVLNIQYRKLPNGDFNHSSVITLLAPSGEILKQTSNLGSSDPEFVAAIVRLMKS